MPDQEKVREVPFAALSEARREMVQEVAAVNWLLAHLAESLPPESPTAKAIGRRAGWEEILQLARWEGVGEIASLIEEARQMLGSELPSGVRVE